MITLIDQRDMLGGLPEYVQRDLREKYVVMVHILRQEDLEKFSDLMGEEFEALKSGINERGVKSCWYPPLEKAERGTSVDYIWVEDEN